MTIIDNPDHVGPAKSAGESGLRDRSLPAVPPVSEVTASAWLGTGMRLLEVIQWKFLVISEFTSRHLVRMSHRLSHLPLMFCRATPTIVLAAVFFRRFSEFTSNHQ